MRNEQFVSGLTDFLKGMQKQRQKQHSNLAHTQTVMKQFKKQCEIIERDLLLLEQDSISRLKVFNNKITECDCPTHCFKEKQDLLTDQKFIMDMKHNRTKSTVYPFLPMQKPKL